MVDFLKLYQHVNIPFRLVFMGIPGEKNGFGPQIRWFCRGFGLNASDKVGQLGGFLEAPNPQVRHEKNPDLLSIESWLVNRDPYVMVYYNALYNWVV